ncbi:pyruvate dehydrogenase phosphatase regulatory subunit, mitochondrial [Caerostris extrusa]|uniref:Pyruvate dehydrogenase phosphatase regulatory subunit, mitochondrial n=1 Tax=Caerostris extrusa TaxID=172846 RepID=A0AAV4XIQ0_CAEEX|nr:pyruvate dehydrogenase phosphatase regulatory subunit, mitochondrial [Caerostris extrusa]
MGSVSITNMLLGRSIKRCIDLQLLSRTSTCLTFKNQVCFKSSFASNSVPQSAQVIICGAGATGNSVAYHMNENGWKDIIVLEQSKIGSGDSWRSCGIVGHFHSMSEGRMTTYSSELYKNLQNDGHEIGFIETGSVNVARTKERMIELTRIAAEARIHGISCDILEPKDISKYHPFAKSDDLVGGIWVPSDGIVNPLSVCQALAKISQDRGSLKAMCLVYGTDEGDKQEAEWRKSECTQQLVLLSWKKVCLLSWRLILVPVQWNRKGLITVATALKSLLAVCSVLHGVLFRLQ